MLLPPPAAKAAGNLTFTPLGLYSKSTIKKPSVLAHFVAVDGMLYRGISTAPPPNSLSPPLT